MSELAETSARFWQVLFPGMSPGLGRGAGGWASVALGRARSLPGRERGSRCDLRFSLTSEDTQLHLC